MVIFRSPLYGPLSGCCFYAIEQERRWRRLSFNFTYSRLSHKLPLLCPVLLQRDLNLPLSQSISGTCFIPFHAPANNVAILAFSFSCVYVHLRVGSATTRATGPPKIVHHQLNIDDLVGFVCQVVKCLKTDGIRKVPHFKGVQGTSHFCPFIDRPRPSCGHWLKWFTVSRVAPVSRSLDPVLDYQPFTPKLNPWRQKRGVTVCYRSHLLTDSPDKPYAKVTAMAAAGCCHLSIVVWKTSRGKWMLCWCSAQRWETLAAGNQ